MEKGTIELMRANLHEVFGERDEVRRAAAARRTYTDEAVFLDHDGPVRGWAAIVERAEALLERAPHDATFREVGPVYLGDGRAALAWEFGQPGVDPLARGLDIATVSDGRISTLETLLSA